MDWIKVTDRLPETGEECLVAFHSLPEKLGFWQCYSLSTFIENKFHSWELNKVINHPTHWMPLPESPKD